MGRYVLGPGPDAMSTLPARIIEFLCDTTDCFNKGVWLCPGGVIACETHKPKNGAKNE